MNIVAIIPARYASTRFPGKPLAQIKGKTMIQRVYEQARLALENVYVATDDERIYNEVIRFQGNVVMTSSNHESGTDRLAEAIELIEKQHRNSFDIVINVQGDEPFIQPEQIDELINCFNDPTTDIATLVKEASNNEEIFNPNIPKVVISNTYEALYFSRSPIPYIRNKDQKEWFQQYPFKKHLGMYGYRKQVLKEITKLEPSPLEKAESLEQNRWLENGYKIKTALTKYKNHPVDTPDDLNKWL
jgi:3-deoxy-manno-octulosonate cytidylyltransferase (CMP-KDO synthetase)